MLKRTFLLLSVLMLFLCLGCSEKQTDSESKSTETSEQSTETTGQVNKDSVLIQDMFDEAAARWHAGDKAVLYDMEFEYLQEKHTYDEYLEFAQIQYMEADSLDQFLVKNIQFFDRDSAKVSMEAVFVGPLGDTSRFTDLYPCYFHRGRWIMPTVSVIHLQLEYEQLRRAADSAIEAENDL